MTQRSMILVTFGCFAMSRAFGSYQYGWAFLVIIAVAVMLRSGLTKART